jgi:hypothetical protein
MEDPTQPFNVPPGAPNEPQQPQAAAAPTQEPVPHWGAPAPAMPPLGPPYAPPTAPPRPTFPPAPPEEWPWTPPLQPFDPGGGSWTPAGGRPREPGDPRRRALLIAAIGTAAVVIVAMLAWGQSNDDNNGRFVAGAPTTTEPVATDSDSGAASDSTGSGGGTESGGTSDTQQDLEQAVLDIQAFVERERGLTFKQDVDVQLANDRELEALLEEEFTKDRPALLESQQVLRALALVSPTFDLTEAERTLLNGSVLGFYDPETKKLVVRGTEVTPFVREVLAHELTHALDDQWFDLNRPQLDVADDETSFGFAALAEGDAMRIEHAYVGSLSQREQAEAAMEEQEMLLQHPEVFSLPQVLIDIAQVPYTDGLLLVQDILDAGQRQRLDAAFQQPPTTSEQVIEPDKFLAGEGAVPVAFPVADGTTSNQGALGAFMFEEMLLGSLNVSRVDTAIAGWGGDAYVTWIDASGKTCLRDTFVGDTPTDTAELAAALMEWAPDVGATVDAQFGQAGTFTVCS